MEKDKTFFSLHYKEPTFGNGHMKNKEHIRVLSLYPADLVRFWLLKKLPLCLFVLDNAPSWHLLPPPGVFVVAKAGISPNLCLRLLLRLSSCHIDILTGINSWSIEGSD